MVTRKDVAKRAYVSTATVSNVVNNKPGVSDDLRERVWKVIHELGYRPNYVARSLKTNKTNQIALVSNMISNPYFAEVTRGIEDAAYELGYMVSVLNINTTNEHSYIDELIQRQFDGIIINASGVTNSDLNKLARYNIPIICSDRRIEDEEDLDVRVCVQAVGVYHGVCELLEYIIGEGHTRIGFVNSERDVIKRQRPSSRVRAIQEVLSKHGIDMNADIMFLEENTLEMAFQNTLKMLALPESSRPTVIFAGNDYLAIGVYSAIAQTGLRIPEDISVVGVDNMAMSMYFIPPLTTLYVPNYDLGRKYVEELKRKIDGETLNMEFSTTRLVIRQSVKKIN